MNMKAGDLPVTERAADEVLSLPLYPEMTTEMVAECVDALRRALVDHSNPTPRRAGC